MTKKETRELNRLSMEIHPITAVQDNDIHDKRFRRHKKLFASKNIGFPLYFYAVAQLVFVFLHTKKLRHEFLIHNTLQLDSITECVFLL